MTVYDGLSHAQSAVCKNSRLKDLNIFLAPVARKPMFGFVANGIIKIDGKRDCDEIAIIRQGHLPRIQIHSEMLKSLFGSNALAQGEAIGFVIAAPKGTRFVTNIPTADGGN